LEALACGTPVVATRCGGPEGLVIDGETGQLVSDKHDPAEFAGAVSDLLGDPEQLEAMRARCAALAVERYAFPIVAGQLEDAYRAVREAPPRPLRLVESMAAVWAVFVFVAYMQHQMALHWPAIREQILLPLLGMFR
jgi:hypothetical protein